MAKYTVLLEVVAVDDVASVVVSADSLAEAISLAKQQTGQSVVEVEENFLEESE